MIRFSNFHKDLESDIKDFYSEFLSFKTFKTRPGQLSSINFSFNLLTYPFKLFLFLFMVIVLIPFAVYSLIENTGIFCKLIGHAIKDPNLGLHDGFGYTLDAANCHRCGADLERYKYAVR